MNPIDRVYGRLNDGRLRKRMALATGSIRALLA